MLTNEQIRKLYYRYDPRSEESQDIRDLILSHIEVMAENDEIKFWRVHPMMTCRACDWRHHGLVKDKPKNYDEHHDWTPAQWFEEKKKEVLSE